MSSPSVTVLLDSFQNSGEMLDEVYQLQCLFHLVLHQEYPPSQDLPCILHLITDEAVKEHHLNYPLQPLDSPLFEKALYYEKKYLPQLEKDIRDYFQLPQASSAVYDEEDDDPLEDSGDTFAPPSRSGPPPSITQANERYNGIFFSIRLALLQDFKIYDVLEAYVQDLLHYHRTSIPCYEESLAWTMALAEQVRAKYPNNKNAARFTPLFEQEHKNSITAYKENLLAHLLEDEKQRECMSCTTLFQKAHELKTWLQFHGADLRFLSTYIRCLQKELFA
jgi:hypothetical protein